eukprot:jgi/Mesvir1/29016/Mv01549-RA.1
MAAALKTLFGVCSRLPGARPAIRGVRIPQPRKTVCYASSTASSLPRTSMDCPHFGACPGCSIQPNESRKPSPTGSRAEFFFSNLLGSPVHVETTETVGYRMRSKLAVRKVNGRLGIGLFQSGSHELLEISDCLTHSPLINAGAALVRDQAIKFGILAHEESRYLLGALRYVQICAEGDRLQITLVFNGGRKSQDHPGLFAQANPGGFQHILDRIAGMIRPDTFLVDLFCGSGVIGLHVCQQVQLRRLLSVEVNPLAEAEFARRVAALGTITRRAEPEATTLETATTASSLHAPATPSSARANSATVLSPPRTKSSGNTSSGITSSDSSSAAVAGLRIEYISAQRGIENLPTSPPATPVDSISFVSADLSTQSMADVLQGAQACIVDPPRKGAGNLLLADLTGIPSLRQLVYVSCGFDALEGEATWLMEHGWRVQQAHLFNLFPGTDSVESLVEFVR